MPLSVIVPSPAFFLISVQHCVNVSAFPYRLTLCVSEKENVLAQVRLAPHSRAFRKPPRRLVARIAFGVYSVYAGTEKGPRGRAERFPAVSAPAIVFIDYIADLDRSEVPASAENISDDLSRLTQFNGEIFVRQNAFVKIFPAAFPGNSGVSLELVVLKLRQEFVQVVPVGFPEAPQYQTFG